MDEMWRTLAKEIPNLVGLLTFVVLAILGLAFLRWFDK